MAAQVLAPERVAELQRAPFTYEPVGATVHGVPQDYRSFRRSRLLGQRDFASAAEDLMTWRVTSKPG
jgi:hypothetical protein